MIEAVRVWLKTCPLLGGERLNVDFLPDDINSFSVDSIPVDPIVKRYVNGDTIRQFLFVLSSRNAYGMDVLQNLENLGFFESFAQWVEEQSVAMHLPEFEGSTQAQSVEVTSTGYAFDTDVEAARYQIQLKLFYRKEHENADSTE